MKKEQETQIEAIMVESSINRPSFTLNKIAPPLAAPGSRLDDQRFDYTPADISKAENYRNAHSYKRKLPTGEYERIAVCSLNQELTKFGVGLYLYVQLFRRLVIVFAVMSLMAVTQIVFNCLGSQYDSHSASFSNYMIRTSFGNYNQLITMQDPYVQTGLHCLVALTFFIFMITWKGHSFKEIGKFERDNNIVHPRKYCVEVEGLPKFGVKPQEIQDTMETFGPVYEVCIVKNMKDNLSYFHELDQLDQEIREVQIEVGMENKGKFLKKLEKLMQKKKQLLNTISNLDFEPKAKYCYVHFEYQSSKQKMLDYYNEHYMFDSKLHRCFSKCCCCCFQAPEDKYLYKGVTKLRVKSMEVPDPDEINWESVNIKKKNKFLRVTFAAVVIVIFLAICSILMAICSVFITSNTITCLQVSDITLQQASTADEATKKCYCVNNIFFIFNNNVKSVCLAIFEKIQLYNGLQIISALVSTITNLVFTLLIQKLVDFTRPSSLTSSLISKSIVLFIFLFLNTCVVPVLIFSNFNGFKLADRLSLLNLNTSDIPYYSDFTSQWYRTVAPFFTNFLIIDVIVVWLKFVWQVCRARCKVYLGKKKQGKTIQRKLNQQMTDYKFDVIVYLAEEYLIVFLGLIYCGGIPILLPICLFSLASRYITSKFLILRYSSRIEGIKENLNEISYNLLPLASVASCLIGLWMLTQNSLIYPNIINVSLPVPDSLQGSYDNFIVRSFYLSYTFVLACLIVVYVLLYNTIVRFMRWLISLCYCSHKTSSTDHNVKIPFSQASATLNVLCSYDIHQNDKYRNAINNMEKYLLKIATQHV